MTLEQLRVFVAVAERLHVTRAAAALNLTQSAASAAIQALESNIGQALFNRVGRGLELAEAGIALLPAAKAILKNVADAEQMLEELQGLVRGHLRLHASQTIAGYWLPPVMHRFRTLHPGISLALEIGNTAEAAKAVIAGEADLGFVEGDVEAPLLARTPVASDRMVLVVGVSHPWAGRTSLTPSELTETRWVLRERGSGTRQIFEDAIRSHGLDVDALPVAMELPSNEAVRSAVEAGAGATVISRLVASAKLAIGALIELPLSFPDRQFVALRHGDRNRTRAATAFLDLARLAGQVPGQAGS